MIPFLREPTRVYALDGSGRLVAEITFPETAPGVYTIDHTFVDASLRGQGVAGQLLRAAVDEVRAQGKQTRTSCWYAAQWFERHPEEQDLLYRE